MGLHLIERKGSMVNPDEEFVRNLKKRIKDNSGYCLNKPKGLASNKCPCDAFRNTGECDCGLYIHDLFEEEFE